MTVRRRRRGAIALSGLAICALSGTGLAFGDDFPDFSHPYTQRNDGDCSDDPVDPITIVFSGPYGRQYITANQIEEHAGWTNEDGSHQNLRVNVDGPGMTCNEQGGQRANHGNFSPDRYHTRLWAIPASLDTDHKKTVADPHYELVTGCGHLVPGPEDFGYNGFDKGRDKLMYRFATGGHDVAGGYWGNTRTMRQCNGAHVGSTGGSFTIHMGHNSG